MSSPEEQMKRFAEQAPQKSTEIFETLLAVHGHFYAVAASEIANMTLAAKMCSIVGNDTIADFITESLAVMCDVLVRHHSWNGEQFMRDVGAFIETRHQKTRIA